MRINKPVSLDISRLCQSKTVMYEFWYDYVKPKYGENTKLFYMDTESFIVQVKTEDIKKKNISGIQICESAMCGYFCIGFIDFIFKGESLLEYINFIFSY